MPVSGSAAVPPSMFTPPLAPGAYHEHLILRRAVLALSVGRRSRDEVRSHPALLRKLQCRILDGRRVVDQVGLDQTLLRVRRGLDRDRLRRRRLLARHFALQHRRLGDRPDRLAGRRDRARRPIPASSSRDDLARLPVDRDVEEVRRHRRVVVPDVVMHHLEVPLPLAGLHVDRDDAVAEQVVARAIAAVLVASGHADGDVDESEVRIRRSTSPTRRSCRRPACRSWSRSSTSPRRTHPAAE